ncbi:hypothetical protein [Pseudomonas reinekei]|uniref:Uncharacterized protein n=1 Tax=Pseudomonas reinekei TaxID=395598 RepID=A0A1Q9WZ35_PSERE|nr:hypothetical protein [Pseudomonas reinekei]OLU04015.1 hypothetical protein BVK86_07045 [Pseudomonas reinekei]
MHLLNVLKQLGIATAVALAIGMVIGPSQVLARVAEFSIGRNLHPTWSARAGVFCGPIAAAYVLDSFGASVLLSVMCGFLLLCFIATWRLPITQKASN